MENGFRFCTESHLVKMLAIRAKNPIQLLEGIKKVPSASIYYHTHRFLQQHYYASPEPPNDFAYWISNVLGLRELGESIASVEIVDFDSLDEIRKEYIKRLEEHIFGGRSMIDCVEGHEFHFLSCKTFVHPTPFVATNLDEFKDIVGKIYINSIYFHIFEPRLRFQRKENDFSVWLRSIGEEMLADRISKLDPYAFTIEGLRKRIVNILERDD